MLIAGCAVAAVLVGSRVGARVPVLTAARDLPVGHVITSGDLAVVDVAADPQARLLPATDRQRVVGATTTMPVAAGTLLTGGQMGRPHGPPAGKAVAAVAVEPGSYPPGLTAGAAVAVIITPAPVPSDATGDLPTDPDAELQRAAGTVVSVAPAADGAGAVVALLLEVGDAELVAAADADRVALVATAEER